jgi:hypothetical protein
MIKKVEVSAVLKNKVSRFLNQSGGERNEAKAKVEKVVYQN